MRLHVGNRDIVVGGGSAGSIEVVCRQLAGLPPDRPAAVLIAIHRTTQEPNLPGNLLATAGPLPAGTARNGKAIVHGRVCVPPSGRHLLVGRDHVHVRRGPRENRTRPAIDPLFRSAAANCSTCAIGVLLSGMLDDGTAGLLAVKRSGGLAVSQDPDDAFIRDAPVGSGIRLTKHSADDAMTMRS